MSPETCEEPARIPVLCRPVLTQWVYRMIADSANSHVEEAVFDSIDASRHGLKLGDQVAVTPEDNGKLLVVVHV